LFKLSILESPKTRIAWHLIPWTIRFDFLILVLVLVSLDGIMAPSSLPHQTSSTAAALSFDGIVIKSWFFCCYCVVVGGGVCVVFLSVVCCSFFVCSVVGFCAALVVRFCAALVVGFYAKMYIFLATLYVEFVALLYINIGFLLTRLSGSFLLF
jgi:hypothetical protein